MDVLGLLKHSSTFFGLHAPTFTWVAAALIPAITITLLVRLHAQIKRQARQHGVVVGDLRKLQKSLNLGPKSGLPLQALDQLDRIFSMEPALSGAWYGFKNTVVTRRTAQGEESVWATQPAEKTFADAIIIEPFINRSFYSSVPGIMTGTGLLFTFLAILVALLDVHTEQSRVTGLELLIQGLSGKFLSSIAALASATIYLVFEKNDLHRLTTSRQRLVQTIDSIFPQLSQAQILADLSRDISEQSAAFRSFNTDLSQKLKSSLSESMGPTLARMVTTIEELNQLLRSAEAQKQESMAGTIDKLLQRLELSMTESLRQMSSQFHESMSSGTMEQFNNVAASLGGTAALLEQMNTQSTGTQAALTELVQFAKQSTSEQLETGRNQVHELTEVLRGLMLQLNETAGTSVTKMAATLTTVVHDLSERVSNLGEQMSTSMTHSTGVATNAANDVIAKAEQWSTRSAEQLAALLEAHRSELGTVKELRSALEESLTHFQHALTQYATVTAKVDRSVTEASTTATAIAGTVGHLRETHDSAQRAVALASKQIETLAARSQAQQDAWEHIRHNLETYEAMFARVEANASKLLNDIGQHLANYVQVSQKGFENLATVSDEHFRNATAKLGNSVAQLDEVLQDLSDDLGKSARQRNGGGR